MSISVRRINSGVDGYEDYVGSSRRVSDLVLNGCFKFVFGSFKSGCVDEPKLLIVI